MRGGVEEALGRFKVTSTKYSRSVKSMVPLMVQRAHGVSMLRFLAVQSNTGSGLQALTSNNLASTIVFIGAVEPISNVRQPGLFGLALLSKVLVTL